MIKKITIVNNLSESVVLELGNPGNTGFSVLGVDGLGPSKAHINVTTIPSDGVRYNSARLEKRNIVFDIEFFWLVTESIEELRQKSYRYFPIKRPIDIYVETDNRYVKTSGYVESNEPDIFSDKENTKISVICPDPYLYSVEATVINFKSVENLFSFPFSNESLTEDLIIFSNISADQEKGIFYSGDAPVGITMYVNVLGPVTNPKFYNLRTGTYMRLDTDVITEITGEGLNVGDVIVITTVKGQKRVLLYRDGMIINILNSLGAESVWFELDKGDNIFYYTADSGVSNLQFRIEHNTLYEGI